MKRMVSEKRTQVYFPEDLYRKVARKAKEESKSSAQLIREAVTEYLVKKEIQDIDWESDPIFRLAGIGRSGLGDLAKNHDVYLYGAKAKKR
jgi:predicted DNA-binding protein